MSSPFPKSLLERATDGCHRYGWLLNIIVMGLMLAFASGKVDAKVAALEERLDRIERQLTTAVVTAGDQNQKLDDRLRYLEQRLARVEVMVKLDAAASK